VLLVDDGRRMRDYPTMIVTLDAKRRFSIPAKLAPASPGDQFDATFDADEDAVILRRVPRKKSWLDVMKACPVPMDNLPPRSREMPKKLKL
jgi:bifunctional DNA-binding transcriptional regulator/antitoxin component of YhaV-PrlF toxin-antitoxin module